MQGKACINQTHKMLRYKPKCKNIDLQTVGLCYIWFRMHMWTYSALSHWKLLYRENQLITRRLLGSKALRGNGMNCMIQCLILVSDILMPPILPQWCTCQRDQIAQDFGPDYASCKQYSHVDYFFRRIPLLFSISHYTFLPASVFYISWLT